MKLGFKNIHILFLISLLICVVGHWFMTMRYLCISSPYKVVHLSQTCENAQLLYFRAIFTLGGKKSICFDYGFLGNTQDMVCI